MAHDLDRPPRHARPLAEALQELVPELERLRLAYERAHAQWLVTGSADPVERYFPPRPPPPTVEDLLCLLALNGTVKAWGRATPGSSFALIQPPLWHTLRIGDVELGYVSNEDPVYAPPATPIAYWDVCVEFVEVAPTPKERRRDVGKDALLKKRVELVLAEAARLWPGKRPPSRAMADELLRRGKGQGYGHATLRAILDGRYEPARRLGINIQ